MNNDPLGNGFTLVEMLVAVSILIISVLPALYLAGRGITMSVYSKNGITAKFLAEEAMDFVRNKRDSNFLAGENWTKGFFQGGVPCNNPDGCRVDTFTGEIEGCQGQGNDCGLLRYRDEPTGERRYGHDPSWTASLFRRRVRVEPVSGNSNDEVAVTVTVTWMDKDLPKTLTVKENLFNLLGS